MSKFNRYPASGPCWGRSLVIAAAAGFLIQAFPKIMTAGEVLPIRGTFATFNELWASVASPAGQTGPVPEVGIASVFNDAVTACPPGHLTHSRPEAAHRTLPCGTKIMVRNRLNGRTSEAWVADRGPFRRGRILDMNPTLKARIGSDGLTPVEVTVLRSVN